ncbi:MULTISPECIES: SDR family NAD(P)-dependent oxidoreductase [Rhizobium]|uniref:NAD(P)-dependent dehydrogenase (Short-subunit alcohol dehydrogenase family) n=1 Tax=Rhizobium tropici TaxID=398 RepID=A0A6P1BY13_RHITR|nr:MULTISPECIES: SDR family oxidoreductase [Rhizobium]AGB70234.1 2-deoxy-D-gluconate 3-dehydrogenase [Rhizobium tropici CIAT 899]MBB4239368.1 NAD(P)-dependent dehydrogenase (short-subunit alcohol dehydrogenase family) [Rhizobium tropici]MBB5590638.1 NAD(P)-dependent dehydrogenase (short-subunit alcohol dehydrogenase family) [Rhizobium tropici]MBB6490153.1 NAD(P)-dependent dehydrogenase (short-subunit alcohol dehydrogenase family) [Rhizobium tropici]NEV09360.1 SDR family oxidoreductase [Rhizobi
MADIQAQFPDLKDRTVLVTGGGSGIGASLVEAFARQGAKVAFIDIAEEPSRALAVKLSGQFAHSVAFYHADLRDVGAIKSTVAAVEADLGAIRVLVNNAGWDDRHDIDTTTEEYWDNNQAINLKQVFFVSQAAAPGMRAAGGGAIINFSSIVFKMNPPLLSSYATAKSGIIGLTKSFAGRFGPENIRVNAVLPGMIVTQRQLDLWLTEDGMAKMMDRQCLKRVLSPEDLVGPVLFLASDSSGAMTGQAITVDGGIF